MITTVVFVTAAWTAAAAWLSPYEAPRPPVAAQAPGATATVPPPDISGTWSVTRSWWRRCPSCGGSVIRTTDWVISATAGTVRIDRGPAGHVEADPGGGAFLFLDGLEPLGGSVLRFQYATLRVSPDGARFEGGFGGSERTANPCGGSPGVVTCFASAGWLSAVRVDPPPGTAAVPPGPPTSISTATPTATPTTGPATTTPTSTNAATGTPTPTAMPTRTESPTPSRPPLFLPRSVR